MAKVAKRKTASGELRFQLSPILLTSVVNPRSRAARRASSPSLNTDKSLKEAPRASDATPVLKPFLNNGIQKKLKKKHMTHAQKVRHQKGIEKGEAVQGRMIAKVTDSKSRSRKRQSRRALWEDINSASNEEVRKAIKPPGHFDTIDEDEDLKDDIQPFHGDTEIKVIDGVQVPSFATGQSLNVALTDFTTSTKKPGTFGVSAKPTDPVVDEVT